MPSTELRIFAAAVAVETAHLVDDGLLHPHDGASDVPSTIMVVLICVAAIALYRLLPTWARAGLAGLFGLAGLVGGIDMHLLPALEHGATGSDYTGFGQVAAGLVLLSVAAVMALRPAASPQPA